MAQIVRFPASPSTTISSDFLHQIEAVKAMSLLEGLTYKEIPTPRCVADYGFGVELVVESDAKPDAVGEAQAMPDDSVSSLTGWILVNYSVSYRQDWDSHWRCTGYFRQPRVSVNESSLVTQMYWDYAYELLTPLAVGSVNGAATKAENEFFDSVSSRDLSAPVASCEMRSSWSPLLVEGETNMPSHITAWGELMLKAAGKRIELRERKASL
ncbi:MAG: DUF3000 domain-containing protein [Bifidobacteriaceae bacterium]|jgi:hypothetical protein|nr:DUF3000 domain-containing protein [Bifidobacteriaceae bacterium]MCI1914237.1 DUF3000 domain-containing protein [Bifidobacteriaceae bacterium]